MTPEAERWQRVTEAFGRLAELTIPDRGSALGALARTDTDIHADVVSLLVSHDAVGERFDQPLAVAELLDEELPPLLGRRIGAYQIVGEIGRGGMGAVWEAERADDQYHKRVAIKMIAAGRDTAAMLRRFRTERDLLARLEHRNIATLLDGGVTEEGQPWFAMELVAGEPLTVWCAARRLDVRARLALFRQVCAAVQYAHEHLVVHRDLKPGNILVAADGTVKLLDFGVAKLTSLDEGGEGLTGTTGVALTAAYASPEQLRGESVSTASDIFSLGVVLYELLTGTRPFSGVAGTLDRTATAPSQRISAESAATMGAVNARRVSQSIAGDLDAIVLMALRPEVERRYRSVQQLSDDLLRSLEGRQVSARPDTLSYRASSIVRRNPVATLVAAIAIVALVGATGSSLRQAALARAERDRAMLETARTQQVTQFFQGVLSAPKPTEGGREISVVEAIDQAIPRIDSAFVNSPDLRSAIKNTLGSTLHDMGQYQRARPLLEDALRLRTSIDNGAPSRERADAIYNLAGVENEIGSSVRAESLYVQAIAMYGDLRPVDSAGIYRGMNNLALSIHAQGRLSDAAALYGRVAKWLGTRGTSERTGQTVALINQATVLAQIGRYDEAEPLLREALATQESLYGPNDPRVAQVLQPLAGTLMFEGEFSEAEAFARRAVAINREALGPGNTGTVASMRMLLNILADGDRCADAVPIADEITALRGSVLPENDLSIGTALLLGGWCRAQLGQLAAGERDVREGLRLREQTFPATHWAIAQGQSILGDVIAMNGPSRMDEALPLLQAGYDGLLHELDSTHARVHQAKRRLEGATGKVP